LGKKELIHERDITIRCYELDERKLLVEGTLTDERFFPFMFYTTKEYHDPSVVHKMVVSLTLSLPKLDILSVDVEMPITPMKECSEILSSLQKLKGMSIAAGFTGAVRKLFGKTEGCLHLNNLIISMGSAAIQGLWSYSSRVREGRVSKPKTDQSLILDSCWLWRKDGPIADRYRELQRGRKAGSEIPKAMVVTIDGPAGAGKSTVSRALAGRLGYVYLDTGAIYRAVAFAVRKRGIDLEDKESLGHFLDAVRIELHNKGDALRISVDGEDVTEFIRTEEISLLASRISAVPAVRRALLHVQRQAAARGGVVAEGRDMGTVVFPQADYKFYLDATADERAARRHRELVQRKEGSDLARVKSDLLARDRQDTERETAPLRPPEDAVIIDSSSLTADEVVETIIAVVNHRREQA